MASSNLLRAVHHAAPFSIAIVATVGGCMPAVVPTPDAYRAIERAVALQVLQCPSVTFEEFAGYTRWARGCGREVMITCLEPGAFSGPDGECFPMQDIRRRASFDLDCPVTPKMQLVPLDRDGRTVGVRACGRQAIYQYAQVSEDRYDWTLGAPAKAALNATPQ